jgi:photosystem II stability/assembly factor-like uncharacterized protein
LLPRALPRGQRARRAAIAAGAIVLLAAGIARGVATDGGIEPPAVRPATLSTHAAQAVMLGVARAGARLVAVGERGMVLLSDDGGATWRQVAVPTSATLTAVEFVTPQIGWAVGHYGVVLASRDGGATWSRQFDGVQAAAAAKQAALARRAQAAAAPTVPAEAARAQRAVVEAERLVADGPDKPFLALHFFDERHGFIVGAYNLIFETLDGGAHWQPRLDALDNPKGNHLYAAIGQGTQLFIAGEQGVLFRSDDAGRSFTRLASPYAGSFFALARVGDSVVAAGLRGNAFRSADLGLSWQKVDGLPPVSLLSAAVADDHSLWLANQAGQLFVSRDGGQTLTLLPAPEGMPPLPLTQMLPTARGAVVATLRGMQRLALTVP